MINEDIAQEILHELFSSLEAMETQSAAILQFLKDKGLASEQDLAPYFEQAGNASNVKWRAARVRIDHLLSSAIKAAPETPKPERPESPNSEQKSSPPKTTIQANDETPSKRQAEKQKEPQAKEGINPSGTSQKVEQQKRPDAQRNRNRNQQQGGSHDSRSSANNDRSEKPPSKKTA